MTDRNSDEFTILVVCTGNVCRSPAVERLLRRAFAGTTGIRVVSAGTGALVGEPIDAPMAGLLRSHTVDTDGFSARRLTEAMVHEADLVLALTRAHRGDVVDLVPRAVRRVFTVRELARLTAQVGRAELDAAAGPDATPAERLAALLPLAAARRTYVPAAEDDVVDPYRQPDAVYQRSLEEILPAVRTIAQEVLRLA